MLPTYRDPQLAIFDAVLPAPEAAALCEYLQSVPYRQVHDDGLHAVFRPHDGLPLKGETVLTLGRDPADFGGAAALAAVLAAKGLRAAPTGAPLDAVLAAVDRAAALVRELVGARGTDWYAFSARPWRYPAGTGLSWHNDAAGYSGAFIYYAHPTWESAWGGELLVADPAAPEGVGRFVAARPNRLVFLRGGVAHQISHVSAAAGDHLRTSVAGFFLRVPQSGEAMLTAVFG